MMYGSLGDDQYVSEKSPPPMALEEDNKNQRTAWSDTRDYSMRTVGCTFGIGLSVRFPALFFKHGGWVCLIPLVCLLVLVGIPLYFMETVLGQFTSLGVISAFSFSPKFKGIGYVIVLLNLAFMPYYNLIMAYSMMYFINSFAIHLPWASCTNTWNTPKCFSLDFSNNYTADTTNFSIESRSSSAEEFFRFQVLKKSDGIGVPGTMVLDLLFLNFITWLICFLFVANGVKCLGKIIFIIIVIFFTFQVIFFARGIFSPGGIEGLIEFFTGGPSELSNPVLWSDLAYQMLFAFGIGYGGVLTIASYNQFELDCKTSSIVIPIMACLCGFGSTIIIFMGLGIISYTSGIPSHYLDLSGPEIFFVAMPTVVLMMPLPQFWGTLFFAMLYVIGLNEVLVHYDVILTSIIDEYPEMLTKRPILIFLLFSSTFLLSLSLSTNGGIYVMMMIEDFIFGVIPGIVVFCTVIAVGWIYGAGYYVRDIEFMLKTKLSVMWKLLWIFATPVTLSFMVISAIVGLVIRKFTTVGHKTIYITFGWIIVCLLALPVPLYATYRAMATEESLKNVRPEKFEPYLRENKRNWKKHKENNETSKYFDGDCQLSLPRKKIEF